MSTYAKGFLLGLAMLAGIAAGIELLSTAFEERDNRTQERDQLRD
jgi:hypothetical protein